MLSLLDLKSGDQAMVLELPAELQTKHLLLVHGIHIGGKFKLLQRYRSQDLALIMQNGRRIALRCMDCEGIKVVIVNE